MRGMHGSLGRGFRDTLRDRDLLNEPLPISFALRQGKLDVWVAYPASWNEVGGQAGGGRQLGSFDVFTGESAYDLSEEVLDENIDS
jgi:hypothetical protein